MSKIPAGATHEGKGECRFYVKDLIAGVSFSFCNEKSDGTFTKWMKSDNATPLYAITPIPRDWNGPEDGLPPVGMTVLTDHSGRTFAVRILAYAPKNGKTAVMVEEVEAGDNKGCLFAWMAHMCNFRPIRTAEQRAAEKRDKEIAAIQKASGGDGLPPITFTHAAKLHNAGLRLPVKP